MKVLFWWRVLAVIRVLQKLRWLVKAARAPPRPTPFRGTSPSLAEPGDRGSLGNSSTDGNAWAWMAWQGLGTRMHFFQAQ